MGRNCHVYCKICMKTMRSDNLKRHGKKYDNKYKREDYILPNNEVGINNIPPEVLNIICKTLSWRDIKKLEKALPSSLFINSGVKRDIIDTTLKRLVEQAKTTLSERKEYKKECNYFISDYYFLIRNYQLIVFQTFHSLLNEDYEITRQS